jgi:protease-4
MTDESLLRRSPSARGGRRSFLALLLVLLAVLAVMALLIGAPFFLAGGGRDRLRGEGVGVVEMEGVLLSPNAILKQLVRYRNDDRVRAVLLRIDSPGGGVAATQEIYWEVLRTRRTKKVVASLGSVAASGGLYVAAAADRVVASPGTLTGSISVIMHVGNYEELFHKIGLKSVVIKSGEFKDIGSPWREMTGREKEILQKLVKNMHDQFVRDVAQGRGLPVERVAALADGRVFTGQEAVQLGLVDELGNFEDAVALAGKLAGLKGRPNLIYERQERFRWWDLLLGRSQARQISDWLAHPMRIQYLYAPGL